MTAGSPDREAPPSAPGTERVRARFEAIATPERTPEGEDARSVDYRLKITRVHGVELMRDRDALPPDAGLMVQDGEAQLVDGDVAHALALHQVEILQGFDFDPATGRVTGMLLFDRLLPPAPVSPVVVSAAVTPIADAPIAPVLRDRGVMVLPGEGVNQHFEATLSWAEPTTDLDIHGFHFRRDGLASHVWHGNRPLGPVFWHYGPSTPDALDERLVITSTAVDGVILCAVHGVAQAATAPVRVIADSGAAVELQLPNVRQTMQFESPDREGNLWVPFAIVDGRVVTTDVLATVGGMPVEADLRRLLPDLFVDLPVPVVDATLEPLVSAPEDDWTWLNSAWFRIGTLAVVLTFIVGALRGAGRAMIMGAVGLVVAILVARASPARRLSRRSRP